MSVIALIPARLGSKGIPNKNFRPLAGGLSCVEIAIDCAQSAGIPHTVISTDAGGGAYSFRGVHGCKIEELYRRPELAQDDTPMIAVVQHALEQIPGQPDDIIVLLQPTQPFRTPHQVRQAITLLGIFEPDDDPLAAVDSVVSVVPIAPTHAPEMALVLNRWNDLVPWDVDRSSATTWMWAKRPTRRQDVPVSYRADGTVYACWRETVTQYKSLYGQAVRPLILDPAESCELDTEADWADVERRWNTR
jgi:CMP-N-acetylneuraminic acid synthetase